MGGFELFQLYQQMRATSEFARLEELNRFATTLSIFEANYQDLDRLLWFICDSEAGEKLFQQESRSAWEQAMGEIIRLLQNFVASAKALVDHSRYLYRRLHERSAVFPDYSTEVKKWFVDEKVVQFVHNLRNYCLHYRTPAIGTTVTIVEMPNEKFQRRVTLTKTDLLEFEWNSVSKQFVNCAPASIDLRETINAYHRILEGFYDWFSSRIRVIHLSDYETVSKFYASLLEGKQERHLAALEQRIKAYEGGLGTPFDVLNPFMTPLDASELAPLMRNPHDWVDAALQRVAKYLPNFSATTSGRLHDVVERNRRSSAVGWRSDQFSTPDNTPKTADS